MQELTVVDVTDDSLVAVDSRGEKFRIPLDDAVRLQVRKPRTINLGSEKISPKEIQSRVRAGESARQIAETMGAELDYISRFAEPVLAEIAHMLQSALGTPFGPVSEEERATFGGYLEEKLTTVGASDIEWSCMRDAERGWVITVDFIANEVVHSASWAYEPRKQALHPLNAQAITLSQDTDIREGLLPRLRAVAPEDVDETRFDSDAFVIDNDALQELLTPVPASNSVAVSAIKRDEHPQDNLNHTAELLDSLRKHRGERVAPPTLNEDDTSSHESRSFFPLVQLPLDEWAEADANTQGSQEEYTRGSEDAPRAPEESVHEQSAEAAPHQKDETAERPKRSRASIPSWDEIVFGARGADE